VVKATLGERSNGVEVGAGDVFLATLASAGFGLPSGIGGDGPATLSRDITAFGRCCFKAFNRKDEAVTAFVEGFEEYVSEHDSLLRCLRPWVSARDGAPAARSFYAQQDTLVKLLLGVDHVQTQVLECLVGKMAEHAEDTDADAGDSVPRLCLNQIRWLDRVKDCPKLVASLLEVMPLLNADMQREVIECFPEIIDDRQHDEVVESLLEQMDANSALLAPVLDALSNLNLDSALLATVQHKVMPKLKSAELQVLPLLVKFLLHTAGAGAESTSVLSSIR
jgi:Fanconi anemia group D2 protein